MIIVKEWQTEVRDKHVGSLMYKKTHKIILLFGIIPIYYKQIRW